MPAGPQQRPGPEACPLCGAPLAPEQEWCLRCGAAARTRLAAAPNWKAPFAAVAVVAALSLGVLAAALVKLAGETGPPPPAITRTVAAGSPQAAAPATVTAPPTATAPAATPGGVTAAQGQTTAPKVTTAPAGGTSPAQTTTRPRTRTSGKTKGKQLTKAQEQALERLNLSGKIKS
jgi:hypothetical protein